ncbi:MAG: hypothetical protein H6748_18985 [Spirochaetaceae bacterium]|nr:hypothetical protein [Myxococcales bacterium]MCB9726141.1 hypothetical protein [Spirochaetaceae bacterium]HPG24462.1 hypothetical protein [Myxococcota bacterium]
MDEDLKRACLRAGIKLGVGLSVVAALVGLRIVTVTPSGLASDLAELEAVDRERAAEREDERASGDDSPTAGRRGESGASDAQAPLGRLESGLRGVLGESGTEVEPDAERLVACRLGERVEFMRAADCALRGGRGRTVAEKKETP